MLLVGDIGGTKTQIALFEPGATSPTAAEKFPSAAYGSLSELAAHFIQKHKAQPRLACFGVAGPVVSGRAEITNLPWVVDTTELRASLGLEHCWLINDLAAIAEGVPLLGDADVRTLNEGSAVPEAAIAVIAPGTGLGESFLTWEDGEYRSHPTEGGHCDFAPTGELQVELLRFMHEKHEHVSYERLASGLGLPNLYAFMKQRGGLSEPEWLAARLAAASDPTPEIIAAALDTDHDCAIARATIDLFVEILAAEAANLCLKVWAVGGLYIAGGIPPRIEHCFTDGRFMAAFKRKGRFGEAVGRIPVQLIVNPQLPLLGAARYGRRVFARLAPRAEA